MNYDITQADRAPLPHSGETESRCLGYRADDWAKPYTKYFRDQTQPIQEQAREALIAGTVPCEWGLRLPEAAALMSRRGYLPCETGYTRNEDGLIVVSVLTHMPGVTGEMRNWWFRWHGVETAPYKLWHPSAHLYTAMGEPRNRIAGLTDRQRYLNNVSYVDEYLGPDVSPLTVRFFDQNRMGFGTSGPGETVIVARGRLSTMPVSSAWPIHQVRPTRDGAEMRSRFFVNDVTLLDLPAHSVASAAGRVLTSRVALKLSTPVVKQVAKRKLREFGPDMLFHCASEMNHLATFLPQLYAEFRTEP